MNNELINNEKKYKFGIFGGIIILVLDLLLVVYIVFFERMHPSSAEISALITGICVAILFLLTARIYKRNK